MALMAVPARARYTGVALPPSRLATSRMIPVAKAAPRKEKPTAWFRVASGSRIMDRAMPKLAPELMPRMEGLAMGLLVIPCIKAPDTAKLLPQRSAAKRRGQRRVRMISSWKFSPS